MASLRMSSGTTALWRAVLKLPPPLRRTFFTTAFRAASPEIYDIVCVGGGPAGLSLVSALRSNPATKNLKVTLLDSQDLKPPRAAPDLNNYSNRCSSLTPASGNFLRDNGAWQHLDGRRIQAYHGMEVWDGVSGSKMTFDPLDGKQEFGVGLLDAVAELVPGSRFRETRREHAAEDDGDSNVVATMCENQNLTSALLQCLKEAKDVEIIGKTKVSSIDLGPEPESDSSLDLSQWPIITLPESRHLAARLLVGADGANSPVRNFANIPSHGWDYNQHGVVATLQLDQALGDDDLRTAYQRFLPSGPIALLPLPGNNASLVWSINTPLVDRLKSLSGEDFVNMVNAAFRFQTTDLSYLLSHSHEMNLADELSWRLPNTPSALTNLPSGFPTVTTVQPGSIASFPLRMRHASTYTGHRVALIGDAAHTIHPLAGQGLNLGLADAQALAERIVFGVEHGMDIGSSWCLDEYNAQRWATNNAVMGVCDKLQKIYSVETGPVVWARSAGVEVLERLGGLKGRLMAAAGTR